MRIGLFTIIDEFMNFLSFCLAFNFCNFQFLTYVFSKNIVAPIGSPLSFLVAGVSSQEKGDLEKYGNGSG